MTASDARRARFAVECLEGRDMMSATLAAAVPDPVELRYELENVLISSYQTGGAATHAGGGGGGAGKVQMQDFHFTTPEGGMLLPAVQKVRDAAARLQAGNGLEGLTTLAGVPVDVELDAPVKAGYDLKMSKKV